MIHRFRVARPTDDALIIDMHAIDDGIVGSDIRIVATTRRGTATGWAWVLAQSPDGSTATLRATVNEPEAALLVDRTGIYTVTATATDADGRSAQSSIRIHAQPTSTPLYDGSVPDGKWPLAWIANIWSETDNRPLLEVYWSALTQVFSSILLAVWNEGRMGSIDTMQEQRMDRWLPVATTWTAPTTARILIAPEGSGTDAQTIPPTAEMFVVVETPQTLMVVGGARGTGSDAGRQITLLSGTSAGTYPIATVSAAGKCVATPYGTVFPDVATRRSGSTLRTVRGSALVTVFGVDFTEETVAVGDAIQLLTGAPAWFVVVGVGIAGGCARDDQLLLDAPVSASRTACAYRIYPVVPARIDRDEQAVTDTVRIPDSEAARALSRLAQPFTVTATVLTADTLRVAPELAVSGMVDAKIAFQQGASGTTTVMFVEEKLGTIRIATSLVGPYPRNISITITPPVRLTDRMMLVGTEAWRIRSVTKMLPPAGQSGATTWWVVQLQDALLPIGQEGLSWRLCDVLHVADDGVAAGDEEFKNLCAGDALRIRVESATGAFAWLPARIITARGRWIAIGAGRGGVGVDDGDRLAAMSALQIPRGRVQTDGTVLWDLLAAPLLEAIADPMLRERLSRIPILTRMGVQVGHLAFRFSRIEVSRQTEIPVVADAVSIPTLTEFVQPPRLNGTIATWVDGSFTTMTRPPLVLVEGSDYVVTTDTIRGTGGVLGAPGTQDAGWFYDPAMSPAMQGIVVGDTLTLTSGMVRDRFVIGRVQGASLLLLNRETLRPVTLEAASRLRWRIERRRSIGTCIRVLTTFSFRLPETLWARSVIRSNLEQIDATWGDWLGLRLSDVYDDAGTAVLPGGYLLALRATARAWFSAGAPAPLQAAIACILGEPVLERPAEIVAVQVDSSGTTTTTWVDLIWLDPRGARTSDRVRIPIYHDGDEVDGFTHLARHPAYPERAIRAGDILPAWSLLTGRVQVYDVYSKAWKQERRRLDSVNEAIRASHGWYARIHHTLECAASMAFLRRLLRDATPAHTQGIIARALVVSDTFGVSDTISVLPERRVVDDIFGLEFAHQLDATGGSADGLLVFDMQALSTRNIFQGHDLVTENGSARVVSARGGFAGIPTGIIHPGTDRQVVNDAPTGTPYEEEPELLPHDLTRAGDLLHIRSGPNLGWYRIATVGEYYLDLLTEPDALLPNNGGDASNFSTATDQAFSIYREVRADICEGECQWEEGASIIEVPEGNLRWDGVARGDVVVLFDGTTHHRRVITALLSETEIEVDVPIQDASPEASFWIVRESLLADTLLEGNGLSGDAGSQQVTLAGGGFLRACVSPGDMLVVMPTDEATFSYGIYGLGTESPDSVLLLDQVLPDDLSNARFRIERAGTSAAPETDDAVERRAPSDVLRMTVYSGRKMYVWLSDIVYIGDGIWETQSDLSALLEDAVPDADWMVEVGGARALTATLAPSGAVVPDAQTWYSDDGYAVQAAARRRSDGDTTRIPYWRIQSFVDGDVATIPNGTILEGVDASDAAVTLTVTGMVAAAVDLRDHPRGCFPLTERVTASQFRMNVTEEAYPATGTCVEAMFTTGTDVFELDGTTAEVSAVDLSICVRAGDVLVITDPTGTGTPVEQAYVIAEAEFNQLRLIEDTGLTARYSGRIERWLRT